MKSRTIIQIVLALAVVGLAIANVSTIMTPVKFEKEYLHRRDACAEKLKAIRALEEAYKNAYGHYTGSFDTLFYRLMNEDSLSVINKNINYDKIPADVKLEEIPESEAVKLGYISRVVTYVNPIENLRANPKAKFNLTDEQILNLRYVPYPKDEKHEFELEAGFIEKSGYQLPVFECRVMMENLLADQDKQVVINKLDELKKSHRFPGWKVGDMTQAITDGNFE